MPSYGSDIQTDFIAANTIVEGLLLEWAIDPTSINYSAQELYVHLPTFAQVIGVVERVRRCSRLQRPATKNLSSYPW